MVKRKTLPWTEERPFILLATYSDNSPPYTIRWNLVHEYEYEYAWLLALGWSLGAFPTDDEEAAIGHPPLFTAHLAALDYAAHGQVTTDASPLTHGSLFQGLFCPGMPRWNIFRGQRGEPLVPCFYWDALADDPPPGFLWFYP